MNANIKGTGAALRSIAAQAGPEFDEAALGKGKSGERLFEKAGNCYDGGLSRANN